MALVDFVFTGECVDVLWSCGLEDPVRHPIGPPPLPTFHLLRPYLRPYLVTGTTPA